MKVVIDTNVLLSGVFFGGNPLKILDAWRKKRFKWLVSPAILNEYRIAADELTRKYPEIDTDRILELIALNTLLIEAPKLRNSPCRDPNDTIFLEAALAGSATIIISGDKDLLSLASYQKVLILSPTQFLKRLQK